MLKQRRKEIIEYIKANADFINSNNEALNIYEGNLLPYIDKILRDSLSANYYHSIKDRILPINILQRFIDKVSNTYSKEPTRTSIEAKNQEFVDFYASALNIDQSGYIADSYANLFKGFAWEPYIDKNGKPAIRELPFNSFMVMSDSMVNPEEETIFIKFMGKRNESEDSMLLHVYTDTEFDAFYLDGTEASEYLVDNQGVNVIGVIPFVYGKRQKNRLLPVLDSDMLRICKAIPVMLSDAAGAQMFQCFSILYGVDVNFENAKLSPNVIWSLKSDRESDKTPQVGTIKPEADTQKVIDFVMTIFTLWLETKGIRVGSMGQVSGTNAASGIAKVIDEMDVYEIIKKNQEWFEKDEEELWNLKLPRIHNYWIKSGMVNPSKVPGLMPEEELDIDVEFEDPSPMKSRMEEITEIKAEIELGTMTLDQAIRRLHPEYEDEMIQETLSGRVLI
ncbi:MAG: hypothetical protein HUM72_12525 [Dolichospermum sp.]|nr:hypothetical protein [Dolichospermum sp.]